MSDSLQTITSAATHAVRFLEEVATDCCEQYFWMTVAAGIVSLFKDQELYSREIILMMHFVGWGVFCFLNAHI